MIARYPILGPTGSDSSINYEGYYRKADLASVWDSEQTALGNVDNWGPCAFNFAGVGNLINPPKNFWGYATMITLIDTLLEPVSLHELDQIHELQWELRSDDNPPGMTSCEIQDSNSNCQSYTAGA